jgi:hypothetical protein
MEGQSATTLQGFDLHRPPWQTSSALQSEGLQAATHIPPPEGEQKHPPSGPHTMGTGGAASWMSRQSESAWHGSGTSAHAPQPLEIATPPGLHSGYEDV